MQIIDRNNPLAAKKCIDGIFKNLGCKDKIINFLLKGINYANNINGGNWNLNLDLNGKFLRFNVGQEYCIQINKSECLILCMRSSIPLGLIKLSGIEFRGYDKKLGVVQSTDISSVPNCLAKVPDSIGCVINENFNSLLPLIEKSNLQFIEYAARNTSILPQMKGAHSIGAIDFISSLTKQALPNPDFVLNAIKENENIVLRNLKNISELDLKKLASEKSDTPYKTHAKATIFVRNPYIVELCKRLANGVCQDCGLPAPFFSKVTSEPYLEVHHIRSLSEGGKDTIENVVALCPNCHRKRHYG